MSLEQKIAELTEIMTEHNKLLREMIDGAKKGGAASASADAGDKPKRGRKPKEETASDEGSDEGTTVDADDLKATQKKVSGWLKEFADNEDDPETEARREVLAAALTKLEVGKISEITSEETRQRVEKWIDKKIEAGRIKPAPSKKAAADDDEEI